MQQESCSPGNLFQWWDQVNTGKVTESPHLEGLSEQARQNLPEVVWIKDATGISWGPSQETSSSWPVQGLWWKAVKWYGSEVLSSDQIQYPWPQFALSGPLSQALKFKTFRTSLISFWFKWNSKIVTNRIQSSWWMMTIAHTSGNQAFVFHYLLEVLNHIISWSRACTASAVLQPHLYCKDWLYSPPSNPNDTVFTPHKYPLHKLEKFQRKIPLYVTTMATVFFRIPKDHMHTYIPEHSWKSQGKTVQ